MLSIIFYTFTFSYFDDAKEHNIIMADYHYLYEASEKTKRHKAVLTGERSLEVVDNDNGSNGAGKKLKNKKEKELAKESGGAQFLSCLKARVSMCSL